MSTTSTGRRVPRTSGPASAKSALSCRSCSDWPGARCLAASMGMGTGAERGIVLPEATEDHEGCAGPMYGSTSKDSRDRFRRHRTLRARRARGRGIAARLGAGEAERGGGAGGADGGAAGGADGGAETATVGTGAIFGADVDPALLTALTSLAARTRELVGAVVLTDAAVAELDAVAGEIELLTARLGARPPARPLRLNIDPKNGRLRQPHSPLTGDANPLPPPIPIPTTPP